MPIALATIPVTLPQEWARRQLVPARPQGLDADEVGDRLAGLLVLSVVALVANQAMQGALVLAGARAIVRRGTSVEAYGATLPRLGALLLLSLLAALAGVAGLVLLVVPGIYILVRLSVSLPALLIERLSARRSLVRSRDLVRGRWWPTFAALLLTVLLVFSIAVICQTIVTLASGSWFAVALATGVSTSIALPIQSLVGVLLYVDLRQRNEGFTFAELAAALGRSAKETSEPSP